MNSNQSFDEEESFALGAYGALPRSQPPPTLDARILTAAHAANVRAVRSPRRWTAGLATAAVAVLAVGIAWRGIDWQQPGLRVSTELPATPRMQPAFKTESETPRDNRDAIGPAKSAADVRAKPASADVPEAEPALSGADWQSPVPLQEPKRNEKADAPLAKIRSRDAAQGHRESREVAAPVPFPAAPAPPPPAIDQDATTDLDVAVESPARQSPVPMSGAAPELYEQLSAPPARAGSRPESRKLGVAGENADAAATQAAAGPSSQATRGSIGAVTAQGIHAGTTSLRDAVAAARLALSRGEPGETRRLVKAIVSRFGRASLPDDLRSYAED